MLEHLTDIPDSLNPEYVRVWLNGHAAMGHKLITVYTWNGNQVFVFEYTHQPASWLFGKNVVAKVDQEAHA